MSGEIEVQNASDSEPPSASHLVRWARKSIHHVASERTGLTLRIIDREESARLNGEFRGRGCPTNVLSFPFDDPPGVNTGYLGDLAICAPVVDEEARRFNLDQDARWAHMVVHGVLHLAGYDHEIPASAQHMERLETEIMSSLGFDDPYTSGILSGQTE